MKVPGLLVVLVREGPKADTLFNPNVLDQCRRLNAEVAPALAFHSAFAPAPCSSFSLSQGRSGVATHINTRFRRSFVS